MTIIIEKYKRFFIAWGGGRVKYHDVYLYTRAYLRGGSRGSTPPPPKFLDFF